MTSRTGPILLENKESHTFWGFNFFSGKPMVLDDQFQKGDCQISEDYCSSVLLTLKEGWRQARSTRPGRQNFPRKINNDFVPMKITVRQDFVFFGHLLQMNGDFRLSDFPSLFASKKSVWVVFFFVCCFFSRTSWKITSSKIFDHLEFYGDSILYSYIFTIVKREDDMNI